MLRKEEIYEFALLKCKENGNQGVTTNEISESLNILRNNISYELNQLVKEEKLSKTTGRPVLFYISNKMELKKKEDPFLSLIGEQESLKNQIEQAKSAMVYPPHGLHSLLIGSTGVGKTHFARLMHRFASIHKKNPDLPFITFNCADYSNNPELLVSHLFGHVKGAFTGADQDKVGIISKANSGMLFLDEIHRLPPVGQEMVFFFLDTEHYGRLGETTRDHHAQVTLICATTEKQSDTLLETFLRRIPIKVTIPNLQNRTAKEQVDLFIFFATMEAERINSTVVFSKDAVKAILGVSFKNNVGGLKSTLQMVFARLFLNNIASPDEVNLIYISFDSLPVEVKSGLFNLDYNIEYRKKINSYIGKELTINHKAPNKNLIPVKNSESNPNLSDIISKLNKKSQSLIQVDISKYEKYNLLQEELINSNLNYQISNSSKKYSLIINSIVEQAQVYLNNLPVITITIISNFIYEKFEYNKFANNIDLSNLLNSFFDKENNIYTISKKICDSISKQFDCSFLPVEVELLAFMLSSLLYKKKGSNLEIIVLTHGDNIASNMVSVAKSLIKGNNIHAIDMPLNVSPSTILSEVEEHIKSCSSNKDILILTDMGSLYLFSKILEGKLPNNFYTIDMVSTPIVIEALRLSSSSMKKSSDIYYSLLNFKGYHNVVDNKKSYNKVKKNAVIVIKNNMPSIVNHIDTFMVELFKKINVNCSVIEIYTDNIATEKQAIEEKFNVLFATGLKNYQVEWSFIKFQDLLSLSGEEFVLSKLNIKKEELAKNHSYSITLQQLIEQYIEEYLVLLNPKKIASTSLHFIELVTVNRSIKLSQSKILRLCVHICIALDRSTRNENINFSNELVKIPEEIILEYKQITALVFQTRGLKLSLEELKYIIQIIEDIR